MLRKRILLRVHKTLRRLDERRQLVRAEPKPQTDAWRRMLGRLDAAEAERRLTQAERALNLSR